MSVSTMTGTFGERKNVCGKELLLRMHSMPSTEMHVNKHLVEMQEKPGSGCTCL